jgi:putative endonuclease
VDSRRAVGKNGEDLAAEHLRRKGYKILERNWRNGAGELDIVARHRDELVFVEVRTIDRALFGLPEESVGPAKQRKLARLATAYVQHTKHEGEWRIDVVAIDRDGIRHIENAVSLW